MRPLNPDSNRDGSESNFRCPIPVQRDELNSTRSVPMSLILLLHIVAAILITGLAIYPVTTWRIFTTVLSMASGPVVSALLLVLAVCGSVSLVALWCFCTAEARALERVTAIVKPHDGEQRQHVSAA